MKLYWLMLVGVLFLSLTGTRVLAAGGEASRGCCDDDGQIGKLIGARLERPAPAQAARFNQILASVRRLDQLSDKKGPRIQLVILPDEEESGQNPNGGCTVTVFRRRCRIISNYPVPIEDCRWYPEHYQGKWNEKKKCCEVDIPGYGRVCVTKPIYIWF